MILDIVARFVELLVSRWSIALLCILTPFLAWRFLSFRIREWLYPDEPREYPHWIPVLGHAISFFRDSHGTYAAAREYFGDTREPFALTIAGQKMYILTSVKDVAVVYKQTSALTFDGFMYDMMVSFEAKPATLHKMWLFPQSDGTGYQSVAKNPHQKCLAQLTRDFHHQQLEPGPQMTDIAAKFLNYIDNGLQWEKVVGKKNYHYDDGSKVVLLKEWCGDVLVEAATRAFFGDTLCEMQPDLCKQFYTFDDESWKLIYRFPRFLAPQLYAAKDTITASFVGWFRLPPEKRQGEAWFVRTLEAEQRVLGVDEDEIAKLMVMIYWAINSNTYKMCFWMLSYLLHYPQFIERIREETLAAFGGDEVDLAHLCDRSPCLNAFFDEVMRITNSSSSVRSVDEEVRIQGVRFRKGSKLLIPYRQLHMNQAVFGSDARAFNPDRFLDNKALNRNPNYRPFGGGSTYCPGRFIARQEVVAFVSIVLFRYDVGKDTDVAQEFPVLEEMKPCLGVMGPVQGADLAVRVAPRKMVV